MSRRQVCSGGGDFLPLIVFAETVLDQHDKSFERCACVQPFHFDQDGVALTGGEHHQPHDRGTADRMTFACHSNLGGETRGATHELRRGPRMQSLLVRDHHLGEMEASASLFPDIASPCHALIRRKDLTGHADIFAPRFLRLGNGLLEPALASHARELY